MGETVRPDGKKIKEHRRQKGWSQEVLAENSVVPNKTKAGNLSERAISKKTIENAEKGEPVYHNTLGAIAAALGVDVAELLPGTESPSRASLSRDRNSGLAPDRIPPLPSLFVGREDDLRHLKDRLSAAANGEKRASLQVITAVRGWPGVGKTTLACAIAHDADVAAMFPDGILWASLGPEPDLLSELLTWCRALTTIDAGHVTTLQEACSFLTSLLRQKRMLLILDDLWQVEHFPPFRVGGRMCATLVTTRLTSVAESILPSPGNVYKLDILSEEKALELLEALAPKVVAKHPRACRTLVRELEYLPLTLQVAGRLLQAETRRGWSVVDLLDELRSGAAMLAKHAPPDLTDLVNQTSPTVVALLKKSTDCFDAQTRERFALLGVVKEKPATFDVKFLRTQWQIRDPKKTVDLFVDRGLLESVGNQRFQMHALLVALAHSMLAQ